MTGHHLARAGARITFVVRAARARQMPAQFRVYSYDDGSTAVFDGFDVRPGAAALAGGGHDFVVLALDGASLGDDEGRALLAAIGDAIGDGATQLVVGSIGIGLRELVVGATRLPDHRVSSGRIAALGHKTQGVTLKLHPPTDPQQLAQADFGMRHLQGAGFVIEDRNPELARGFAEIFDRSGLATCQVVPADQFALHSRAIFPVFLASELLGWPDADRLTGDATLWPLCVEAVRAIMGLAEHGQAGAAAAAGLSAAMLSAIWRGLEAAALPLDWQSFNAYQHGDRVRTADHRLLEGCVRRGEAERRDMAAVRELLARVGGAAR